MPTKGLCHLIYFLIIKYYKSSTFLFTAKQQKRKKYLIPPLLCPEGQHLELWEFCWGNL